MYSINHTDASSSARDVLAGKPFRAMNNRRRTDSIDDEGAGNQRSKVGIKRAARERAMFDESESDLRNARMGISFGDEDYQDL